MNKIKSLEELNKIREKAMEDTIIRITGENPDRIVLAVGMATCGIAAGARPVMTALLGELKSKKLTDVSVIATGCMGFCYAEPIVELRMPDGKSVRYKNVTVDLARDIVNKHLIQGVVIDEAVFSGEVR